MTPAFELTPRQHQAMAMLAGPAVHCALGGGSRSGKSFLALRAMVVRALKSPGSRHAAFRFRFNSIKASLVLDTLPKMVKGCFPGLWERCELNRTDWYFTLPNGSQIWFCGLDDKERTEKILGQEYATVFFNECSQIPYTSVVLALTRLAQKTDNLRLKAYYDFNPPGKRHWTYRRFVDKVDPDTGEPLRDPSLVEYFVINPKDNARNIAPEYIRHLESLPESARNRFLLGKFSEDSEGALWTEDTLAKTRKLGRLGEDLPDWQRVVVAVDPSGASGKEGERSDEIGIVVVALGTDGHAYVLEDLSGRFKPADWGRIAVEAYRRHGADRIVAEVNFGGAMVEAVIRAALPEVPFTAVTASRGKVVRAEPVAALYEQGRVHHVGYFPEIEEQQLAFHVDGYQGLRSPDRADALIWALTELFPRMTKRKKEVLDADSVPVAYSAFR